MRTVGGGSVMKRADSITLVSSLPGVMGRDEILTIGERGGVGEEAVPVAAVACDQNDYMGGHVLQGI